MADFQRLNMSPEHYTWGAMPNNSPHVSGEPDGTPFNPKQGEEVLHLLNVVLSASAPISALHEGDELIRDQLPADAQTQLDVKKWLDANL